MFIRLFKPRRQFVSWQSSVIDARTFSLRLNMLSYHTVPATSIAVTASSHDTQIHRFFKMSHWYREDKGILSATHNSLHENRRQNARFMILRQQHPSPAQRCSLVLEDRNVSSTIHLPILSLRKGCFLPPLPSRG